MNKPQRQTTKPITPDKLPFEVFEEMEALTTIAKRDAHLKKYDSFVLRTILQANFDKNIVLELPEGTPPFVKDLAPPGASMARLNSAIKVLGQLVVGNAKFNKVQKEVAFIKLLEGCNQKDAEVLIAMKDKTLSTMYPTLTLALVKKAIPSIF
jgi:hypothetical protein